MQLTRSLWSRSKNYQHKYNLQDYPCIQYDFPKSWLVSPIAQTAVSEVCRMWDEIQSLTSDKTLKRSCFSESPVWPSESLSNCQAYTPRACLYLDISQYRTASLWCSVHLSVPLMLACTFEQGFSGSCAELLLGCARLQVQMQWVPGFSCFATEEFGSCGKGRGRWKPLTWIGEGTLHLLEREGMDQTSAQLFHPLKTWALSLKGI